MYFLPQSNSFLFSLLKDNSQLFSFLLAFRRENSHPKTVIKKYLVVLPAKNTLWDWYLRQYSSSISDSKSSKTTGEVTSSEELVHEAAEGETGGVVVDVVVRSVELATVGGLNGST